MLPEMPGRIGRYEIDRRIGSGGMALTYRCRLEGLGGFRKKVVVKVLHPDHIGDEAFVQMFLDEARLSARLHHANIAQVFEVGDDHGIPYMVMEFVNGPNLASLSRRIGPFGERPYGLISHMLAAVARGLDHAHHLRDDDGRPLGIVHRDVSLGNIVISGEGVPKLIDFGIAKWNEKNNVTEVGLLKGKLHYMAPEQLSGDADHRADVYQLGVCLFWLATGRPPFHHEDPARVWKQRLAGEVPRPSALIAGFPAELEEVILTSLATDPADRWSSASEMADMLEAFCYSHPRFQASDDAVSEWVRSLVPPEEFEDPSSRAHATGTRRSLGEMMTENASGAVAPISPREQPDGGSELTMRPETAPAATGPSRTTVAVVSSIVSLLLAAGASAFVLFSQGNHEAEERAALIYLEEANRLVEAGDLAGAAELVVLAENADPQDPDTVVELLRIKRAVAGATGATRP